VDAEKDRLGDKLRDIEHARENKFFADRDKELLEKLRGDPAGAGATCPLCNKALRQIDEPPLTVDACPDGHGWWITPAQARTLAHEPGRDALARLIAAASQR
jgi:hypothetical protein